MSTWPTEANNRITLLPPFEHKEAEDDDCGVPEHPIYADYTKYLWKGHRRSGGVQIIDASTRTAADTDARPNPRRVR